jgi:AraC-like DNA-binding protein
MKILFTKPHPLLSSYIDRYWSWESESEESCYMPHVSPGVGMDFYFHYRQPFMTNDYGALPESHLIYSDSRSSRILPAGQIGFVAVRFRCAMFGNFTKIPVYELADNLVDAGTLWKLKGKQLEEQMAVAPSFEERVRLLELFFLQQLNMHKKKLSIWKDVINELFYHHEEVRLDQLAKKMKITPRHFRRAFREASGMAPKHFQQLSRFRAVLKQLLISRNTKYLPVALDKGYFDQTHFIKEFKRFMGETPASFLTANNFRSHFYYPSL